LIRFILARPNAVASQDISNRVFTGKDKEEVGLKRGRSNSSANAVQQRVPLGPGRASVAPPITNVAPVRAPPPRATLPPTSVTFNPPKRLPRIDSVASIKQEVQDDIDMDVEDEPVIPPSEGTDALSDIPVEHYITSEVDNMIVVDPSEAEEDSDDEATEIKIENRKAPKVWPDLATVQKIKCQREVQAIREVFDDDDEDFDPSMVSEYSEEIFEYMSQLEVCHVSLF